MLLRQISSLGKALEMGNQQSGSGSGGERGGDKNKDKEKKRYEPPVPTRVGKKRKQAKV